MNEFKGYHPVVNFTFFILVIGFSCFYMHPFCLIISTFGAISYSLMINGKEQMLRSLAYIIPLLATGIMFNALFNRAGDTVLLYLPWEKPLTAEAVVYGVAAAMMLLSVIIWFSCYNAVMTSDKFIYLFGRIIPSLSLVVSMTLRFVPRFLRELRAVSDAQKCIGKGIGDGNLKERIKNTLSVLSVMMTRALENSVETADSMRARGYGLKGRTNFSVFRFIVRDVVVLAVIIGLGALVIIMRGSFEFQYFPLVGKPSISGVFFLYAVICFLPCIIEIWEVIRWGIIKSKI